MKKIESTILIVKIVFVVILLFLLTFLLGCGV